MNPTMFFRTLRRSIPQLKAEIARQVIAVEAAEFHDENFRRQGYADTGVQPWKPRKDQDSTRSLLVKTGRLRQSATAGRTRGNVVDFVMPIYGKVHNEGGRAGRGRGFRMPKRQFAGPSRILKERFKAKAQTLIKNRLNRI